MPLIGEGRWQGACSVDIYLLSLPSWPPASSVPAASMPACHNHHILLQQRAIHLPIEALQPWHAMEKMSCLLILAIEVAATNTLLGGSGTTGARASLSCPCTGDDKNLPLAVGTTTAATHASPSSSQKPRCTGTTRD